MTNTLVDRILKRSIATNDGCLICMLHRNNAGYAMVSVRNGTRKGTMALAHRALYQELRGPIPEGLVLDHLCGNRACVFIGHLEPVTQLENVSRGAAGRKNPELCRAGLHPWTGFMYQSGGCPDCKVEAERQRRKRLGISY